MNNLLTKLSLQGHVALVTGGGSGLGAHFAKTLASAGAKVAVVGRRQERVAAVAAEITSRGGEAFACEVDVSQRLSVNEAYDQIEKALGTVNILVNNAGQSQPAAFTDMTEDQWSSVMDTNVGGTYRMSQEMANRLSFCGKPGSIINIASITGILAKAMFVNYGTSKAAIIHLTKSMAMELLSTGIRVNALAPGYFPTEMTEWYFETETGRAELASLPPARLGRLDELDGPLMLLASDASSYINGIVIPVDYGHSVRLS